MSTTMNPPLLGQMMDMPLLVSSLITHAARHMGHAEIVSRRLEGDLHRYTYRDCERRSRSNWRRPCCALGVEPGERVGTLAWNGYRHLEAYYGISGMGAVCHTINPRLFPEQIVYIINHADDRFVLFDISFAPLVDRLAPLCPQVRGWIAMTDEAHLPAAATPLLAYETLLEAEDGDYQWPLLDERQASSLCYTSGTTGNPKGRALFASFHRAARLRGRAARRDGPVGARFGAAGGADVPCQRLGPAVRGAAHRREAGAAGQGPRRQVAVRADGGRARDLLGRRADGLAGSPQLPARSGRRLLDHGAHGDRRLGLSAGHAARLRGRLRRAGDPRLGHDGNVAARHAGAADLGADAARRDRTAPLAGEAGARDLWRGHAHRRRGWPRAAVGRRRVRRAAGARALGDRALFRRQAARRWSTAGFPPATSPPSMPTASCRSPTAART